MYIYFVSQNFENKTKNCLIWTPPTNSCPHTHQNGKVERNIRTINNLIRTVLNQSSASYHLWHYTLSIVTYLFNITPHKTRQNKSPTMLLYLIWSSPHFRVSMLPSYPLYLEKQTSTMLLSLCLSLNTFQIIEDMYVTFSRKNT